MHAFHLRSIRFSILLTSNWYLCKWSIFWKRNADIGEFGFYYSTFIHWLHGLERKSLLKSYRDVNSTFPCVNLYTDSGVYQKPLKHVRHKVLLRNVVLIDWTVFQNCCRALFKSAMRLSSTPFNILSLARYFKVIYNIGKQTINLKEEFHFRPSKLSSIWIIQVYSIYIRRQYGDHLDIAGERG